MATIAEQLTSLANTKAAIKQSIINKGVQVADTDPFSAYPAKIGQISGGGGATTKFGVSLDNLLGNVDENGSVQIPETEFIFDGTGIKTIHIDHSFTNRFSYTRWVRVYFPDLISIGDGSAYINAGPCYQAFSYASSPSYVSDKIVDLPALESINGQYAAEDMFRFSYISSVNMPKLTTINGTSAAKCMFAYNKIPQVSLPSLTTINGSSAASQMFLDSHVESVDLSALTTVSGSSACRQMFQNNPNLIRVDFPSLVSVEANSFGTTSTNAIFASCTGLLEIHFRADAQAMVEGLSAYQYKFGAPSTCTIYFDLIGTITVNGVAYSRNEPNSIRVDGNKTFVAWKDASDNIVYTDATAEPAVDTPVYSDAGTTQVGTVSEAA